MANSTGNQVNNQMQSGFQVPSDESFNNTIYQGLNPINYYNTGETGSCSPQGCVLNRVDPQEYFIPSIEQLAQYGSSLTQNSGQLNPSDFIANANSSSQQTPGIPQSETGSSPTPEDSLRNPLPATPATVLNYGATMANTPQMQGEDGITDIQNPYPVTPESLQYLNGFIRTQIGRRVSIDFLVGSNAIVTKQGYLLGVASNYIVINELDTNDITTCDFYNIKFIRFYY